MATCHCSRPDRNCQACRGIGYYRFQYYDNVPYHMGGSSPITPINITPEVLENINTDQTGWQCPRCNKIWSPFVHNCDCD